MRLITEEVIKKIIFAGKLVDEGKLHLPADCMLTPSAKAVIVDSKLTLAQNNDSAQTKLSGAKAVAASSVSSSQDSSEAKQRYKTLGGDNIESKPEHMTLLHNNVLVPKDDARIYLRGQIDLLIAELLKTQLRTAQLGCTPLVDDLEDVYGFIGKLSRSEVLDEPFAVETVIGLSYGDVQDMSHHPKRYFDRGHLFNISYQDGELTLLLNALRALSRHCELAFYEAFKESDGTVSRLDLMEGFNRLSSIFYLLCLRATSGKYGEVR